MEKINKRSGYRDLLTEREYMKNLIAGAINRFGDSVDAIAFSWLVYTLTGSTALTAVTFGVNALVSVLLMPVCGALVSNMSKRRVVVVSDICRGALVCVILALFLAGRAQAWMLICSTGLMSAFEAFRVPAGTALFPLLVPKEKYTAAMALNSTVKQTAELAGKGLAGTIIAFGGIGTALAVDVFTFALCALILSTLKLREHAMESAAQAIRGFAISAKEGLRYLLGSPLMVSFCFVACIMNLILSPLFSLQAPFINEGIRLSVQGLSIMGVALSCGMLLGSVVYPKLEAHFKRYWLMFFGILCGSLSYVTLAGATFAAEEWVRMVLLAVIMALFGFSAAVINISFEVGLISTIDQNQISRVTGMIFAISMAATPLGSFVVAGLSRFIPITALIFWSGAGAVVISLSLLFIKPLRGIDN